MELQDEWLELLSQAEYESGAGAAEGAVAPAKLEPQWRRLPESPTRGVHMGASSHSKDEVVTSLLVLETLGPSRKFCNSANEEIPWTGHPRRAAV